MKKFTPVGAQQNRWFTMQSINNQGTPISSPFLFITNAHPLESVELIG